MTGLRIGMVEIGLRNRHVLGCDRGALAVVDQQGAFAVDNSSQPAPFDLSVVSVEEVDDAGRVVRVDLYDEDQLGDALARYDGLATTDARPTRPRGWERFERLRPPDADELAMSLTPEVRIEDHRTLIGVPADGIDDVLDRWNQMQQDTSLRVSSDLLATRGEHFALSDIHLDGTWGLSGDVEQSFLSLGELDDDLKTVRIAFFDVEDRDRAFVALDELVPGRPRTELAVDAVLEELLRRERARSGVDVPRGRRRARRPPVGRPRDRAGRYQVTDFLGRMRQTLSSADVRVFHVLEHEQAGLYIVSISGALSTTESSDLAPFESLIVSLTEYDDTDLAVRWHIYDETQLPDALARYDALAPEASRPSAPTLWTDAVHRNLLDGGDEAFNARDVAGYRSILHPELRVFDFRSGHPQEYGRDGLLASMGFDFDDASRGRRDGWWVAGPEVRHRRARAARYVARVRPGGAGAPLGQRGGRRGPSSPDRPVRGRGGRRRLRRARSVVRRGERPCLGHRPRGVPAALPGPRLGRPAPPFAADLVVEDHRLTGRELHRSRDDYFEHIRSMRDQLVESDIRCIHLIEALRATSRTRTGARSMSAVPARRRCSRTTS